MDAGNPPAPQQLPRKSQRRKPVSKSLPDSHLPAAGSVAFGDCSFQNHSNPRGIKLQLRLNSVARVVGPISNLDFSLRCYGDVPSDNLRSQQLRNASEYRDRCFDAAIISS